MVVVSFFIFCCLSVIQNSHSVRLCTRIVSLCYDKQGGPRSDEVTTMRFADAVGVVPNSQSRVVMIGLYSKHSASVAVKSSA